MSVYHSIVNVSVADKLFGLVYVNTMLHEEYYVASHAWYINHPDVKQK